MNRDYDWSPPKNDIRNIPPKVQEKYKKEDTRYLDDDKDNINNYRNEYSERFYNNAARNIPITPKRKSVPKYIIIFLLLISFIFICIGIGIDVSIMIVIFLFIILPLYIIFKNRFAMVDPIKMIVRKFILYLGIIIIIFFIFNTLQYIGKQTLVIDNILKLTGLKEYTKEEIINNIKINTDDNHLSSIIKDALYKTDNNTLRFIKSINVVSEDKVSEICGDIAIGCADMSYSDRRISDANIYVSDLSTYIDSCGSFSHTLYHEIGHVNYSYNNGYKNSIFVYEHDPEEIYADSYADRFSKEKCSSNKYKEIDRIEKETREKLRSWDRYGETIPYELYDIYLKDYNANIDAINNYDNYMNSNEDIIDPQ